MSHYPHSFLLTIVISLSVLSLGFNQQSCQVKKDQSFHLRQDCERFYSEKHINETKNKVYSLEALKIEAERDQEICQRYCETTYKGDSDLIYACTAGQQIFFSAYQRILIDHWKLLQAYKAQASGLTSTPTPSAADDDTMPSATDYQKENDPLLDLVPRVSNVLGRQALTDKCQQVAEQSGPEKNKIAITGACETGFNAESSRATLFLPYWPEGHDMGDREAGNHSPK